MSTIFKFLFELGTDPLGLPIDKLQEYAILAVIGFIAYLSSYRIVGIMYDRDMLVTRTGGSFMHWTIRFVLFFAMWFVAYAVIWLGKFVIAHWAAILVFAIALFATYMTVYHIVRFYEKGGETNV
jgi:hypothetical protein